jgi:hypothetical protein
VFRLCAVRDLFEDPRKTKDHRAQRERPPAGV